MEKIVTHFCSLIFFYFHEKITKENENKPVQDAKLFICSLWRCCYNARSWFGGFSSGKFNVKNPKTSNEAFSDWWGPNKNKCRSRDTWHRKVWTEHLRVALTLVKWCNHMCIKLHLFSCIYIYTKHSRMHARMRTRCPQKFLNSFAV